MKAQLKPGSYYHIYNRGNNKDNIFLESKNYRYFLQKYAKYCYPVLDTYAFCLLKNHFHLLVRVREHEEMYNLPKNGKLDTTIIQRLQDKEWTPQLISQQLANLFNGYTQAVNKMYNRSGALFERPFERKIIDEDSYFSNVLCYIHKNPQLHGFMDDFRFYPYSSYSIYALSKKSRINTRETLKRFGGIENFKTAHTEGMKLPENYKFD